MIDESTEGEPENGRDGREPRNANRVRKADKTAEHPPQEQPQQEPAIWCQLQINLKQNQQLFSLTEQELEGRNLQGILTQPPQKAIK